MLKMLAETRCTGVGSMELASENDTWKRESELCDGHGWIAMSRERKARQLHSPHIRLH